VYGVEALVAAAGVSRRHLEILFRQWLRVTPAAHLAKMRVERAKAMLSQRGRSLTAVSRDCGFSDLRHFRRVFHRIEGVMPRQYRKAAVALARRAHADGQTIGSP
jgi:transcriptional regulator GlxA family with amidase domain